MESKRNIIDNYYQFIKNKYCCETLDELLGKKYIVDNEFGTGNFLRMKIEDGLKISRIKVDQVELEFNNRELDDDILEVGYCYDGEITIISMPDQKKYRFKAGDMFICKMLNDINSFKFKYKNCKSISIQMNFSVIGNAINPIWENKLILDWQKNIDNMLNENILLIEKSSYDLKKIAEEIDEISSDDVMGYMKLKLRVIEFLTTFFEKKLAQISKNIKRVDIERTAKAKEIINKDLEDPPLVDELAYKLKTSVCKLQQGFKDITGNTVYKYIKKTRIEKAEHLLKNTDMPVLEVANEVGYQNPSKFSSSFKQYHQITPLKYRKANKNDCR